MKSYKNTPLILKPDLFVWLVRLKNETKKQRRKQREKHRKKVLNALLTIVWQAIIEIPNEI